MPCYNAAKFVGESIQSILAQTYTDLELVVVDDCSTDNSKEVVRQFGDPRVRLIELSVKGGRVKSGNLAIRESESEFIARLDADDLMAPDRISEQVRLLDERPNVGIVCSYAKIFGEGSGSSEPPSDPDLLRATLTYYNPITHSSATFRRSAIADDPEPYDEGPRRCEDYDLWIKISTDQGIVCIPKHLVAYRRHPSQLSGNVEFYQRLDLDPAFKKVLAWIGVDPTEEELRLHRILSEWGPIEVDDLFGIETWLHKLVAANEKTKTHPSRAFATATRNRFHFACLRCSAPKQGMSIGLRSRIIRRAPKLAVTLALRNSGILRSRQG